MGGHDLETITITLNGVEVSGHPGMTVLELARESGVHIPTLCHHPRLAPIGACRICLVEEEKSRALLASCVTPIAPGMMINTASPRVLERRKIIVKLMLASHPDSCMVCDKGNRCELRKVAADMGVGLIELDRIPQLATIEEVNPFIERDHSRCILCAKCIRADQELVVEGAIDYLNRGFCSKPATLGDLPLEKSECTFCGTCVAVCPTGALMEKVKPYRGAVATTVATVCPFCGCGCAICLDVKGGRVVRSRTRENSSVNGPALCVRGSYGCDFIHSPERLTTPMVKVDGELKTISWEQALSLVARELLRIREEYGPGSLAILGSSKCTNEENYLLQKLARTVLGTNNIDNGSRLYGGPSRAKTTLGVPSTTDATEDIERSDVILVIGADSTVSAPLVGYAIKRAIRQKGAKLLLVEPRHTKLARFAHLWLRARPGTDVCLINGLARAAIEEGLSGREYIPSGVQGFDTYRESLRKYTGQHVAKATGVRAEDVHAAGQLLARARHASVVFGSGISQQAQGTDAVLALLNLAALTGNRSRVHALLRENSARGACDMGTLPDSLPGYQSVADPMARKMFEKSWGAVLPSHPGLTAVEMVQRAKEGDIKAMYIVGENPALSFPHLSLVREALASLEFLVVQDMFLTETARLATVVLPAASFAEKEGTYTSFDGLVQRLHQAIEPPGESLPDWRIFVELTKRMGRPMDYSSPGQVMREISGLVPLYHGIDYARLEERGIRCTVPGPGPEGKDAEGGRAGTTPPHFTPIEHLPPEGGAHDDYPFNLMVGSVLYHFGGGTRSSRSSSLSSMAPTGFVEVNREDAERLKVSEGETVRLVSPVGEVTVTARVTDMMPAGTLWMPSCFPRSPTHELFPISLDEKTKTPSLKMCTVRLERVSQDG